MEKRFDKMPHRNNETSGNPLALALPNKERYQAQLPRIFCWCASMSVSAGDVDGQELPHGNAEATHI